MFGPEKALLVESVSFKVFDHFAEQFPQVLHVVEFRVGSLGDTFFLIFRGRDGRWAL
jgi:hypothetical protein